MTGTRDFEPSTKPPLLPPIHDGLAIAAFVTAWFMPPVGFILGCVSVSTSRSQGRKASGLAAAAITLSCIFALIIIIVVAVAVHKSQQLPCDLNNPNWPNC